MEILQETELLDEATKMYMIPRPNHPPILACLLYSDKSWRYRLYRIEDLSHHFWECVCPVNHRVRFFADQGGLFAFFYMEDDTNIQRVDAIKEDGRSETVLTMTVPTQALLLGDRLFCCQKAVAEKVTCFAFGGQTAFELPDEVYHDLIHTKCDLTVDRDQIYVLTNDRVHVFNLLGRKLHTITLPFLPLASQNGYAPHIYQSEDVLTVCGLDSNYSYISCSSLDKFKTRKTLFSLPDLYLFYRFAEHGDHALIHGAVDLSGEGNGIFCYLFNTKIPDLPIKVFFQKPRDLSDRYLGELKWLDKNHFAFLRASTTKSKLYVYPIPLERKKCVASKIQLTGYVESLQEAYSTVYQNQLYILSCNYHRAANPTYTISIVGGQA